MKRRCVILGYGSRNPDIRKTNIFFFCFHSLRGKRCMRGKKKSLILISVSQIFVSPHFFFGKSFFLAASLKPSFAVKFNKMLTAVRLGMCWQCCLSHWPTVSLFPCSSICLSFPVCHFYPAHTISVCEIRNIVFARCFVQYLTPLVVMYVVHSCFIQFIYFPFLAEKLISGEKRSILHYIWM